MELRPGFPEHFGDVVWLDCDDDDVSRSQDFCVRLGRSSAALCRKVSRAAARGSLATMESAVAKPAETSPFARAAAIRPAPRNPTRIFSTGTAMRRATFRDS